MTIQSHTELAARARSFAESQESIAEVLLAGSTTFVSRNRASLAQNTANILRELAAALESPTPPERVQAGGVPVGWQVMHVESKSWGAFIDAMDRAERKGYLPDAVVDEWLALDYNDPAAPTEQEKNNG